jgi:hypothetical protein
VNQLELYYTYAWEQHEDTPCVAVCISNQQNVMFLFLPTRFFFYKFREQEKGETRSVPVAPGVRGGTSGRGEVVGKRLEDKYDANNVYTCM